MRNDVNGINASVPLQQCRHLTQAIRRTIEQKHLGWFSQAVDQGLVIGNAGINKDDVLAGQGFTSCDSS
jgi:hypothetical protein